MHINIHIMTVSRGEDREKRERIYEAIMAKRPKFDGRYESTHLKALPNSK